LRRIPVPLYALALAGGIALGIVLVSGVVFWVSGGDDGATVASVTLDEVGCTYEGDETPNAPFFYMDINNLEPGFNYFEVDGIPADVTTDEVKGFFEDAQETLEQGGVFPGVPADWRLNRRTGIYTTETGSMLVGDPIYENQGLVAGQRYVVWCSTGEPPTAVSFAAVIEATA
jgi:hypothetical protein